MKTSNIIITAIIAVVSIVLLWLWYLLGFNQVDAPLDLVVSIVWWAVIIAGVVLVVRFEKSRRRQIRTMYVAPTCLFNSEFGITPLAAGVTAAPATIARLLDAMEYGFSQEEAPDQTDPQQRVDFRYIVHTDVFKPEHDGSSSHTDERWEGEVVNVATGQTTAFASRAELAALLA